ncbi:hypothetical protein, variant 1 [Sphaeroforma arctica JP610]|uniref:Arf-GAP domain-containing protein n=1 Tax=Sphaeroforma arctica JP610 TaxID=667725 RepID=A0A0L0FIE3_9EUKA|nr:hypothetical protein, variant 1 [Sphaeroforma arctica JP610]KNC76552.1 hypothetical protein, variant 1 [Sphaeroforma arctica JP610]|eukprot:XP_014150454.1 hypothetical protein, variant 1 [Sphaeroforma arctica JP610]
MAFFQLGSKALQPLEPLMKDCFDQLKSMKSSFAEMQQQDDADYDISVKKKAEVFLDEYIAFQINDLKKDSDSPNMRKRSTTEVTKSGYLFVGEKKQFGYTWDRSYFYIIDGVLMRQSNHTHMTTLDPSGVVSDGIDRTADMLPILSAIMTNSPTCADCGEPGADWVSINIGVVICIQCSGIHRSLGVIISQVRSLTLDAWKPGMLTILTHTDNQRVNEKYEHIKPHHGDTKPTPDSPRKSGKRLWNATPPRTRASRRGEIVN